MSKPVRGAAARADRADGARRTDHRRRVEDAGTPGAADPPVASESAPIAATPPAATPPAAPPPAAPPSAAPPAGPKTAPPDSDADRHADQAPDAADHPWRPVPRRPRADGWTPAVQQAFIRALADTGLVAQAALAVDRSVQSAYRLRHAPGGEGFARAWAAALAAAAQRVLDLAFARAIEGEETPVFDRGGNQVGARRRVNDRMVLAILRAYMPDRFRPVIGGPARTQPSLAAMIAALDPAPPPAPPPAPSPSPAGHIPAPEAAPAPPADPHGWDAYDDDEEEEDEGADLPVVSRTVDRDHRIVTVQRRPLTRHDRATAMRLLGNRGSAP